MELSLKVSNIKNLILINKTDGSREVTILSTVNHLYTVDTLVQTVACLHSLMFFFSIFV